jgi:hypothetical protein
MTGVPITGQPHFSIRRGLVRRQCAEFGNGEHKTVLTVDEK